MRAWQFHCAGEIIFGLGAVERLGAVARRLGAGRVLVVTDSAIVRAGLLARVMKPLTEAGVEVSVFEGGEPEPSFTTVEACVEAARQAGAQALVSLGGGSNTDLAKATATLLKYGGSLSDYLGEDKVPGPIMPLIAVSTTAGTGSEVSGASVLSTADRSVRSSILSNYIRPTVALYDPLLTVTCPPKLTADSGIDALTHAIEAYTAIDYRYMNIPEGRVSFYSAKFPVSDCLALEAIRLIAENLRLAVYQGTNIEAREKMHLASLLAGMAFSNSAVHLVHALEYPVGVIAHCTHGAGNGLFLPYVMAYNLPVCTKELADIAVAMGVEVEGLSELEAAQAAIEAVVQLKKDIGIPMRLRELGVQEAQLPAIARQVVALERLMRNCPRPVTLADAEALLREAW